jgi:hypothetical protein
MKIYVIKGNDLFGAVADVGVSTVQRVLVAVS